MSNPEEEVDGPSPFGDERLPYFETIGEDGLPEPFEDYFDIVAKRNQANSD